MGNIRMTRSVQTIVEIFNEANKAYSGVELAKRFKANMNKTTVYRILDRLEKENILHSFTDTSGLRWYAKSKRSAELDQHSHFQCQTCGKSKCIPIQVEVPNLPNHKIDSSSLLLVGQCEECIA